MGEFQMRSAELNGLWMDSQESSDCHQACQLVETPAFNRENPV